MNSGFPSDSRPPIDHDLRKWLEGMTGIGITDLEDGCTPPDRSGGPVFGDLGDHRWEELTTVWPFGDVLVPARKGFVRGSLSHSRARSHLEFAC